jgi:hypothetical protein
MIEQVANCARPLAVLPHGFLVSGDLRQRLVPDNFQRQCCALAMDASPERRSFTADRAPLYTNGRRLPVKASLDPRGSNQGIVT